MTPTSRPLVSVIVPVYNGEATIGRCVESLLAQDYPPDRLEVIVVDNASTDATAEILRRYPVKLLFEGRPGGQFAARNRGVEASRGEFLAFTDSDCVAEAGWVRALLGGFETPEVGAVAGRVVAAEAESAVSRFQDKYGVLDQERFLGGAALGRGAAALPFAATCNVAFRRAVFDKVGLFDETMNSGGDVDLSWRMQLEMALRIAYRPEAVVAHFHRRTAKGHFRQMKRYATSHPCLAKKYPGIGPKRSSTAELARSYGTMGRLFLKAARGWLVSRRRGGGPELYMESLLGALTILAHQVGYLEGSLHYRTWYI